MGPPVPPRGRFVGGCPFQVFVTGVPESVGSWRYDVKQSQLHSEGPTKTHIPIECAWEQLFVQFVCRRFRKVLNLGFVCVGDVFTDFHQKSNHHLQEKFWEAYPRLRKDHVLNTVGRLLHVKK